MKKPESTTRQRKRKNYIDAWMRYRGLKPGDIQRATGAGKELAWKWRTQDNTPTEEYMLSLLDLLQTERECLFLPPPGKDGEGKGGPFYYNPNPSSDEDGPKRYPLSGAVGAGKSLLNVEEDGGEGLRRIAVLAGEALAAAEVLGDSMGPLFEGWYAIIGPRDRFHEGLFGKLCVVETVEGETLIKWVEKSKIGAGARLVSGDGSDHADNVDLAWAAPVVGLRPR